MSERRRPALPATRAAARTDRARTGTARGAVLGLAAFLACCACGRAPQPPAWQRLAVEHEPAPLDALLAAWNAAGGAQRFVADERGAGAWVETGLTTDWTRDNEGRWRTALPRAPRLQPGDDVRLTLDGATLPLPTREGAGTKAFLRGEQVVVELAEGAELPRDARIAFLAERRGRGRAVDNQHGLDRIEDGLVVWPGERVELVRDVPPGSVLRFTPRIRALGAGGAVSFRVTLDGEVVYSAESSGDALPPARVELGARARDSARIAFEVAGPPAAAAFALPLLAPASIGSVGARPSGAARPDVILFLADTFRADLLAAYGGAAGLTPELDALAERSVLFLDARSPSTWTLPAQASLFTGTWPPQHGAEGPESALAPGFDTLAELFARAGYRTAAVTDGLYVSRGYGLDQGFESFASQHVTRGARLASTLELASELLRADDGRPLFLFVQTYRTHWPYSVGPEEDARAARRLRRETHDLVEDVTDRAERVRLMAPAAARLHEIYREGARALDAQVGPWVRELESAGFLRDGLFVFTSDHGEAFLEHDVLWHGAEPYDEVARIPLFLLGGGEAPRRVRAGATLVDVAPTLARRCGLAVSPHWSGRDLFALADERALFSVALQGGKQHLGVVRGARKLLASGSPPLRLPEDVFAAFALDADPAEESNLLEREAWPRELGGAAAEAWRALLVPLVEAPRLELDERREAELRALGYGGADD